MNIFSQNTPQRNSDQLRSGLYQLFSKDVFLVCGIASAITAVFVLLKTLISAVKSQQEDMLRSLYYFFGNASVPFVNLIIGLLAVLIFAMLAISVLKLRSDAKRTSSAPTPQSFSPLIFSLFCCVIFAIVLSIIALASLSVISYEYYEGNILYPYSANALFVPYVFFAAAAIMSSIGVLRLVFSMKHTVSLNNVSNGGYVVSMIGLIGSTVLCILNFMSNLFSFLMPSALMNGTKAIDPTALIILMISTLISISVTIMLIAATVIVSRYGDMLNKLLFYKNNPYIAQYATDVVPQNQNRKPMPQPAEYKPREHYGYQSYCPAPMPVQSFPTAPQGQNQQFISQPYNQFPLAQPSESVPTVNLNKKPTTPDMGS